jgi:hypothetical protein
MTRTFKRVGLNVVTSDGYIIAYCMTVERADALVADFTRLLPLMDKNKFSGDFPVDIGQTKD